MVPPLNLAKGRMHTWLKAGLSDALDLEFWCQEKRHKNSNGPRSFTLVTTAKENCIIPNTGIPRASLTLLWRRSSASPVLWATLYPSNKFICLFTISRLSFCYFHHRIWTKIASQMLQAPICNAKGQNLGGGGSHFRVKHSLRHQVQFFSSHIHIPYVGFMTILTSLGRQRSPIFPGLIWLKSPDSLLLPM